ncbi:APC family permease [Eggerthella sinensis]|uniref:APC family permease n=1 Tax=Eggerthella sinensis TaxID=242230 RepID=UPI00266DAB78|nr:APC family permease [Eggerthella sinensis]
MDEAVTAPKKKKIRLVAVVFMMYMFISGGSWGLEDMIGGAGPGIALIILLVLPIIWAYPYGLICTELGAKYTEESGFYGWIRRALGKFAAFISGWSMTLANFVDTAVYLVLSIEYLNAALNIAFGIALTEEQRWIVGLLFVVAFCILNLRGIEALTFSTTISAIMILLPFVVTILFAIPQITTNPFVPLFAHADAGVSGGVADINTALMIGLWMFMGYESIHSFSDEVEGAGPLISKAFMWAVPIAAVMYILPTFLGLAVTGDWQNWSSGGPISFVEMGFMVGGNFLMVLFLVAGFVGNLGLYGSYLAFGARVAADMADDKLFFKGFEKVSKKYNTPYVAIIAGAVVTGVLSYGSFADLIIIDVILLLIPVVIILISGIVLRFKDKDRTWAPDVFRLKVSNKVFAVLGAVPILLALYAIATTDAVSLLAGGACIAVGCVMYFVFPRMFKEKALVGAGAVEALPETEDDALCAKVD